MKPQNDIHSGHRERMTKKLIENGHSVFSDHEILEILLFFSIPRKNVNETAHLLMNRFGTLKGILDADVNDLCAVSGIGLKSALLIKVVSAISSRATTDKTDRRMSFTTFDTVSSYLVNLYRGESKEKLYTLFLSPSYRLIAAKNIYTGTVTYSSANIEKISREAVRSNARYIILAHNHPQGIAIPSDMDIESTLRLKEVLKHLEIDLIDHFIVSGTRVTPILNHPNSKELEIKLNSKK